MYLIVYCRQEQLRTWALAAGSGAGLAADRRSRRHSHKVQKREKYLWLLKLFATGCRQHGGSYLLRQRSGPGLGGGGGLGRQYSVSSDWVGGAGAGAGLLEPSYNYPSFHGISDSLRATIGEPPPAPWRPGPGDRQYMLAVFDHALIFLERNQRFISQCKTVWHYY